MLTRRKRTGSTRERTGCITCRTRKKKCDLRAPVCAQCHRLNFQCEWEPPRTVKTPVSKAMPKSRVTMSLSSGNLDLQLNSPVTTPASSLSRHVIRYYVQSFTQLLTATRENNCFLSVFLPMAFEYPTLHQTIVAWAAAHLAILDPKPHIRCFALESRVTALSVLSSTLAAPKRTREAELACCLILCSMDSIVGDTETWDIHLRGAADILRPILATKQHAMMPFLHSFDGHWLLRNFAYHDVLMSVTMECEPLIPGYYWQADCSNEDIADSYFGFASFPIYQISEISSLNAARTTAVTSAVEFAGQTHAIETRLLAWTCPNDSNTALTAQAGMYRSAALLHLYQVISRHEPQLRASLQTRIERQVEAIINLMSDMTPDSSPECTSLFPIFLCGVEASNLNHTTIIRERLQAIMTSRNFRNIENAISVLDEVWKCRKVPGTDRLSTDLVCWRAITRNRGWKLSLS